MLIFAHCIFIIFLYISYRKKTEIAKIANPSRKQYHKSKKWQQIILNLHINKQLKKIVAGTKLRNMWNRYITDIINLARNAHAKKKMQRQTKIAKSARSK